MLKIKKLGDLRGVCLVSVVRVVDLPCPPLPLITKQRENGEELKVSHMPLLVTGD